jgi:hypothetical protein
MWLMNNRAAQLICGVLALLLIAIACQIGTSPADVKSQVLTAVAQTVTAEAQAQPTLTPTPQIKPTLTNQNGNGSTHCDPKAMQCGTIHQRDNP